MGYKIVIRSPNWIGDCIMALPAIDALKHRFPDSEIYIAAKQYLCDLYKNISDIRGTIPLPDGSGAGSVLEATRILRRHRFNLGVLFTNSFSSALLFKLAGIKKTIGYVKDLRGFLLDRKLPFPHNDKHHIHFYLDIVAALDEGQPMGEPGMYSNNLAITEGEREETRTALTAMGIGLAKTPTIIGISTSAAYGSAKAWLPERFSQLIQRLANNETSVWLLGSGKERDKIEEIVSAAGCNNVFNLAGRLSLRQSIAAMSLCNLFISNDSGLMHIASSLDLPLIALFGPTRSDKTGPLHDRATVIHYPETCQCAPCLHRECPLDHCCMKAITVDEVYNAATRFNFSREGREGKQRSTREGLDVGNGRDRSFSEGNKNKAIFLDRDGTIIEDRHYICDLSQSEVFPFAYEAVQRMNRMGYKVIGVTNQSAIARGICTVEQVETTHREIRETLAQQGAVIDAFYYCPYHEDGVVEEYRQANHPWRKPQPGMLVQAAEDFGIYLGQSYMIGDAASDIQAGINAGCKTVLVLTGKGKNTQKELEQKGIVPGFTCENILTALDFIESQ